MIYMYVYDWHVAELVALLNSCKSYLCNACEKFPDANP